uniref:NB-ARC domain-containing protein n=1 Tax=Glycine max TaxID=3847 RepID=A0A0R0EXZ4_SOYBN
MKLTSNTTTTMLKPKKVLSLTKGSRNKPSTKGRTTTFDRTTQVDEAYLSRSSVQWRTTAFDVYSAMEKRARKGSQRRRKRERLFLVVLIHDMILRKVKDTEFCQYIDGRDQSVSSKIVRRLTIATDDFSGSIGSSPIRSIFISTGKDEEVSEHLVNKIPTNYMLLKVLDFEGSGLRYVPENLGNLCHLKKSTRDRKSTKPKSIGKLENLETLDIRDTSVSKMPEETLIIDDDGVVIGEVGKLKQLRELLVLDFRGKHEKTLCSLINEKPLLEKLVIETADKLVLFGKLKRLPNWISQFPNLVQLYFYYSRTPCKNTITHKKCKSSSTFSIINISGKITITKSHKLIVIGGRIKQSKINCTLQKSLKNMPRLLFLVLSDNAYEGETLNFLSGGFQKLKTLQLILLDQLKCILIDRGVLCSLEVFSLRDLSQLKTVPSGIQHLEKLKDLYINDIPTELVHRIAPDGGEDHWIIQYVPHVRIWSRDAEEPSHIFGRSHH